MPMKAQKGLLIALLTVGIVIAILLGLIVARGDLIFIVEGLNGKNGQNGADGINGSDGLDGLNGKDGKSAYEIAVENGFEGTVNEWLLSLVVQGTVGQDGVGIESIRIAENGHLLILLTNGRLIDAGDLSSGTEPSPTVPNVTVPDIHFPTHLVMTKGTKFSIHADQILLSRTEDMRVGFTYSGNGTVEAVENESFAVTPAWRNDTDVTPHANETEILLFRLEMKIDGEWKQVADRAAIVTVVEKPQSFSAKGILIGDSRISDGTIVNALSYYTPKITLLGTRKTSEGYCHEGRAGWSSEDYLTQAEKGSVKNAFYNSATQTFDFSYYMTEQGYTELDFVVINLGANDNFSAQSAENIGKMVQSIRDYAEAQEREIKILVLTEYLSPTSATGRTEAYMQGLRDKQFGYFDELNEVFGEREDESVYLLPNYLCINGTDHWRTVTEGTQDVIHLSMTGYYREADLLRAYLYRLFET